MQALHSAPVAQRSLVCARPAASAGVTAWRRPVRGPAKQRLTQQAPRQQPACWRLRASASAADSAPEPQQPSTGIVGKILDIFNVFSDPACNRKLLALAIGQMLCSIATLMHDSYLPVYVQDELGLSNTKVRRQIAERYLADVRQRNTL